MSWSISTGGVAVDNYTIENNSNGQLAVKEGLVFLEHSKTSSITIPAGTLGSKNKIMIIGIVACATNNSDTDLTHTMTITGESNIVKSNPQIYATNVHMTSNIMHVLTDKDNTGAITIDQTFQGLEKAESLMVLAINQGA